MQEEMQIIKIQFSIKSLLVITTVVAIACSFIPKPKKGTYFYFEDFLSNYYPGFVVVESPGAPNNKYEVLHGAISFQQLEYRAVTHTSCYHGERYYQIGSQQLDIYEGQLLVYLLQDTSTGEVGWAIAEKHNSP